MAWAVSPALAEGAFHPVIHLVEVCVAAGCLLRILLDQAQQRCIVIVIAIVIGIAISAVGIYVLGVSMSGWVTLGAIAIFSVGEMMAVARRPQ